MPEGVCCSASCTFRSYNKFRQKKDGGYELSKLPGAGGPQGTCRHGTMIHIDSIGMCREFEDWDTVLTKTTDTAKSRGK